MNTSQLLNERNFYREQLELIASERRNTMAKKLAHSALTFFDALKAQSPVPLRQAIKQVKLRRKLFRSKLAQTDNIIEQLQAQIKP